MNLVLRDVIETVHSFQIRSLFQTEWRNLLITVHTPSNNKSQLSSQTITYTHSLYRIVCENLMLFLSSTLQGFEIWNVHRRRNGNLWRLSRYRSSLSLRFRTSLFFSDLFSFFSWVLKILFSLSENSDCYFSFSFDSSFDSEFRTWSTRYENFCGLGSWLYQSGLLLFVFICQSTTTTSHDICHVSWCNPRHKSKYHFQVSINLFYSFHFISFHSSSVQFSFVLFCSFVSIVVWGVDSPWLWGANVGHLWRTTGDINRTFISSLSIQIEFFSLFFDSKSKNLL